MLAGSDEVSRATGVNKRPRAQPARPRPEETDRARRVLNTAGWPWRFRRHGQARHQSPTRSVPGYRVVTRAKSPLDYCEDRW
jgi:hypothetical protein